MDELTELLAYQGGVIARRQALECGLTEVAVARLLRRGDLIPVHPGVYVNHNGPMTWLQQAWAAVLWAWPAALDGWSAIRAHEGPRRRRDDPAVINVAVERERRLNPPEGIQVRRASSLDATVLWNLSPPRIRLEVATIRVADEAKTDLGAIAVLADTCGGRRTTAARLLSQLGDLPRLHRRRWLFSLLEDVREGTCSVLEHGYFTKVERAHRLPRGRRQVEARVGARVMFRDVLHEGSRPRWQQIVELDGRLFHESPTARDRDMERDLDAAIDGADTVRLGYGQVFDRSCQTAMKLSALFQRRGWPGALIRCPDCP